MERWAAIDEFPNYEISDFGIVRNVNTNKTLKTKTDRGYERVMLYNHSGKFMKSVHRLVAESFIDNPYNKKEVNHIDGNTRNNCVDNLEWTTRSENMIHAYNTGLKNPSGGLTPKKLMIIETGDVYDSAYECARNIDGDQRHICHCLTGKRKTHKGYHYKYVDESGGGR